MATYKGHTGLLVLGGRVQGAPTVQGAVASAGATVTVDGTVLVGVLAVGDVFEVDGDGIDRTVTGALVVATTNSLAGITFTPSATAGFGNNATVTFSSNSVGEIRAWSIDDLSLELIEDTVKGDTSKTYKAGYPPGWTGTATAYLDYGDTKQAALIDKIATGSPDGTIATLIFNVEASGQTGDLKQFYGAAQLNGFSVSSPEGSSIAEITFNFRSDGPLNVNWSDV